MIKSFGLIFLTLSWLVADHYAPWLSFHSEALSFLALIFLVAHSLNAGLTIPSPRLTGWIALTALLPWLQYISGIHLFTGDALLGNFYQIGLWMAVVVGFSMASNRLGNVDPGWLGLAHALWLAAMMSAAVGLMQWFNLADSLGIYAVQTEINARASGNLAQANQLATLLLMGIASLVYVFEKQAIGKTGLAVSVAFLTLGLVLTQSRAGMASGLIVAVFLIWKQRTGNFRLSRQGVVAWALGFILLTLSLPSLSEWLMLGDPRSLTATESIGERWLIWKQVVYAIGQAPWFGYGWNQTPAANAVGALIYPGSTSYTNAHNIVLDLFVWCGIPTGLLISCGMVYWVITRVRAVQTKGAVLAMAAFLPIVVHSLLEFPFAYAYFLMAAGFFVGIVEAAHVAAMTVEIKVRWLWVVLGIWSGVGGYMAYEYFQIEEDFRIVRFENLRVGATPASYEVPHVWMLSHMAAMLRAARQVPKPDMSNAEMENLRTVSDRFAYGAIRFKYAQALGLNGDPKGASRQMKIIHGMYGDFFYQACKEELARLSIQKYPQLAQVKTPD